MSLEFLEVLTEVLTVVLTSSTKFFLAPFLAKNIYGFSFMETVGMTIAGGWIGVLFFYLFSGWVVRKTTERRWKKAVKDRARGKYKPRKKFTRMNKLIIRVKWGFGLIGLAAITPPLVSIPLGSVLAAKYFRKNPFTLAALMFSVVVWSFLLTWAADFLPIQIVSDH